MMRIIYLTLFLLIAGIARAISPDEVLQNPAQEARARALFLELRCVQCQSESIAESQASIAKDLRLLVRERIAAGDSDAQALSYISARYGEYVLFRPNMAGANIILWVLAPLVFVLALLGVSFSFYKRRKTIAARLSEDEEKEISKLLGH